MLSDGNVTLANRKEDNTCMPDSFLHEVASCQEYPSPNSEHKGVSPNSIPFSIGVPNHHSKRQSVCPVYPSAYTHHKRSVNYQTNGSSISRSQYSSGGTTFHTRSSVSTSCGRSSQECPSLYSVDNYQSPHITAPLMMSSNRGPWGGGTLTRSVNSYAVSHSGSNALTTKQLEPTGLLLDDEVVNLFKDIDTIEDVPTLKHRLQEANFWLTYQTGVAFEAEERADSLEQLYATAMEERTEIQREAMELESENAKIQDDIKRMKEDISSMKTERDELIGKKFYLEQVIANKEKQSEGMAVPQKAGGEQQDDSQPDLLMTALSELNVASYNNNVLKKESEDLQKRLSAVETELTLTKVNFAQLLEEKDDLHKVNQMYVHHLESCDPSLIIDIRDKRKLLTLQPGDMMWGKKTPTGGTSEATLPKTKLILDLDSTTNRSGATLSPHKTSSSTRAGTSKTRFAKVRDYLTGVSATAGKKPIPHRSSSSASQLASPRMDSPAVSVTPVDAADSRHADSERSSHKKDGSKKRFSEDCLHKTVIEFGIIEEFSIGENAEAIPPKSHTSGRGGRHGRASGRSNRIRQGGIGSRGCSKGYYSEDEHGETRSTCDYRIRNSNDEAGDSTCRSAASLLKIRSLTDDFECGNTSGENVHSVGSSSREDREDSFRQRCNDKEVVSSLERKKDSPICGKDRRNSPPSPSMMTVPPLSVLEESCDEYDAVVLLPPAVPFGEKSNGSSDEMGCGEVNNEPGETKSSDVDDSIDTTDAKNVEDQEVVCDENGADNESASPSGGARGKNSKKGKWWGGLFNVGTGWSATTNVPPGTNSTASEKHSMAKR